MQNANLYSVAHDYSLCSLDVNYAFQWTWANTWNTSREGQTEFKQPSDKQKVTRQRLIRRLYITMPWVNRNIHNKRIRTARQWAIRQCVSLEI